MFVIVFIFLGDFIKGLIFLLPFVGKEGGEQIQGIGEVVEAGADKMSAVPELNLGD